MIAAFFTSAEMVAHKNEPAVCKEATGTTGMLDQRQALVCAPIRLRSRWIFRLLHPSSGVEREFILQQSNYILSSATMPSAKSNSDWMKKMAAFLGASGVGLGAIGAHAFKATLTSRGTLANWQTATMYQMFHATALLALASHGDSIPALAGQMMAAGTVMFSGSIFCLSLGVGPKALLGPTTPLGGMVMIGGWIVAGFSANTKGD